MKHIAIFFIVLYKRFLAEGLDTKCRFYPTCSVYSSITISDFGMIQGGFYAFYRLLRCNPYGKSGEDKPKICKRKYRDFI